MAERVLENREAGLPLKSQAVLFRASHHSRHARIRADAAQHPVREVRRAEVSRSRAREGRARGAALGAKIRATASRASASLQLVPGIGPASAARILDRAGRARSGRDAASPTRRRARAPNGRALRRCSMRCSRRASPAGRPSSSWCGAGTSRISNALHDDARGARRRPAQLEQIAASYPHARAVPHRPDARSAVATSDEAGAPLLDEDYLILSTIHSAKGQEWKSVFVLNAVDGCIPSDLATGIDATRSRRSGGCSTSR